MAKGSTWNYLKTYLGKNNITYNKYLKSPHWYSLKIRFRKSSYCKNQCWICGSKQNINIHHKTYRRIGKEWVSDLIELCRTCHKEVHEVEKSNTARQFRLSKTHHRIKKQKRKLRSTPPG